MRRHLEYVRRGHGELGDLLMTFEIDPLVALGVVLATATTDAAYVFFNAAVVARHRIRAANWSAI